MNTFKKLREENHLTQQQFAEKLNVSQQAVTKWETGASLPRGTMLIKISKIFNCSLDELLDRDAG